MAYRSFKSDESFLEKLAMGAAGTKRVMQDLTRQGHKPVELERGSTSYKIWKTIKIKRLRVPDILCVNSGIRVEARAKTTMVIAMSHSSADETRGWNFGLKDDDYVALVVCEKTGEGPIDWTADKFVQYIQVLKLRQAVEAGQAIQETPKGAQEGFETRLTWPCAIARSSGTVTEISKRIQYRRASDNRLISLALSRKGIALSPCVSVGESIQRHQILASVAPVLKAVPKRHIESESHYRHLLTSASISERYGAAKAYSFLDKPFDPTPLVQRAQDGAEHIYVKLEAAAALARTGMAMGYDFIESILDSEYLAHRLEAVIILGELPLERSVGFLMRVLNDAAQHEEVRAGAAWGLGELKQASAIPALVAAFNEMSLPIRMEAARSLKRMCEPHEDAVMDAFRDSSENERPGISWALGQYGEWDPNALIQRIDPENLDMRQWGAYIIGCTPPDRVVHGIESLKTNDPQLYFAVTVLWKIASSWVNRMKEY